MAGYIICLLGGFVLGAAITFVICHIPVKSIGTLRVDQSDPDDDPYLFLELNTNVDDVKKQKYVTLRVNTENYLSQK